MYYRLRISSVVALILLAAGCAHYYEGTVAELEPAAGVRVELGARYYGDCFRPDSLVPLVYMVARPNYTVRIAHGARYWHEFFLSAQDNDGRALNLTGPDIAVVTDTSSGETQGLRAARGGIELTHHARLVDRLLYDGQTKAWVMLKATRENKIGIKTLAFDVLDGTTVLGSEQLRYRVSVVQCRDVDGP